jgi:hypothetical protein
MIALSSIPVFHVPGQMDSGELLTRSTVWMALSCYVASELSMAIRPGRERASVSWLLNAAGCVFFFAHVVFAFHYYYHWSHAAAYAETARQSKEMTGWDSGDGLYVNYIFAIVWICEVVWARIAPIRYSSRTKIWSWTIRAFFLFMIFNGAFIFVRSEYRWLGLMLCFLLLLSWGLRIKRRVDWGAISKSS